MRLNLLLSLLTLFASCFVVAAETASTDKDSLVIGCNDAAPPLGYKVAGELTGFDIDIIQMAVSEMGITNIEFVTVTSATRFTVLQENKVDVVIATSTITHSRECLVDFSIPYFEDGQGFLVHPSITTENP